MEMAGSGVVNMPKTYSLNIFKDFVLMCVFSETSQGENLNLRQMKTTASKQSRAYASERAKSLTKYEEKNQDKAEFKLKANHSLSDN
ncbi:hypothetical protein Fmac_015517 [Flemingia macrophylla]|uniref:Uncharacterized protein n=1 Tax=Flemingia macrophylla TaxID=520843 RepID=A0ABD1MER9_9FABA